MKKLLIAMVCLMTLSFSSCNSNQSNGQVVVNPEATNLGDNLNLQALGELVKSSQNAQDIENKLNTPGSINNLDLDGDGKVDYIKVTEYGTTTKGFSFTVDVAGGQSQEVATVEIQPGQSQGGGQAQQATMNINGNQNIYGNNNCSYSSNYSFTDLMIMSYLMSPHGYYISPYHYGYYPSYYRSYGMVSRAAYSGRVGYTTRSSRITRTTTTTTRTSSSPNRNLSSSTVNARAKSASSPTRSQKSFSTTSSSNSRPSTSGFKSSGSSSSSSGRSSSGSSRSSSSGSRSSSGGSHSFGGGRRSDVRFKTNITPLGSSLDKICSLQGVTYDWKIKEFPSEKFDSKKQIGFIAQDLEKVYPAVVETRTDGYKTVNYDLLVPALVESIKELKAQSVKQDSIIQVLLGNRTLTAKK
jgi:hypothetical protein